MRCDALVYAAVCARDGQRGGYDQDDENQNHEPDDEAFAVNLKFCFYFLFLFLFFFLVFKSFFFPRQHVFWTHGHKFIRYKPKSSWS